MLNLTVADVLFRVIPETLLSVLGVYLISFKPINKKNYCISSIILVIISCAVKMLPIQFDMHTMLNIIGTMLVAVNVMKISIRKSISNVLVVSISMGICEWLNIAILCKILKANVPALFKNSISKVVVIAPSLLLFGAILLGFYLTKYKDKKEI